MTIRARGFARWAQRQFLKAHDKRTEVSFQVSVPCLSDSLWCNLKLQLPSRQSITESCNLRALFLFFIKVPLQLCGILVANGDHCQNPPTSEHAEKHHTDKVCCQKIKSDRRVSRRGRERERVDLAVSRFTNGSSQISDVVASSNAPAGGVCSLCCQLHRSAQTT